WGRARRARARGENGTCGAKASRLCRGSSFSRQASLNSGCVVGRHVHGCSDALIGPAPTDVGHGLVDVLVGGLRGPFEQGRRSHDLSRLAIAALGHVDRRPGLLHRMRAGGGEPLDGDDSVARLHVCDADGAGALHLVIDVHGAGAALGDPAAVFRAGEADLFADDPQERGICLHLHVADTAVDVELCHEFPLASSSTRNLLLPAAPGRMRELKEPAARPLLKHSAFGAALPTATRLCLAKSTYAVDGPQCLHAHRGRRYWKPWVCRWARLARLLSFVRSSPSASNFAPPAASAISCTRQARSSFSASHTASSMLRPAVTMPWLRRMSA